MNNKLDSWFQVRISKEEKEKLKEIIDYYNMPSISTFFRQLVEKYINKYEREKKKAK